MQEALLLTLALTTTCSFLVASHVYVASRGLPTKDDPNPVQYVFSSSADDGSFEVYEGRCSHATATRVQLTKTTSRPSW